MIELITRHYTWGTLTHVFLGVVKMGSIDSYNDGGIVAYNPRMTFNQPVSSITEGISLLTANPCQHTYSCDCDTIAAELAGQD